MSASLPASSVTHLLAQARSGDAMTRVHLADVRSEIEKILDPSR